MSGVTVTETVASVGVTVTENAVVLQQPATTRIVTVTAQGPQGPIGSGAVRIDQAAAASTWILSHNFGRVPQVQVYLTSGEAVIADLVCTSTQITVIFASPQSGFVIVS